jgi:excisionase family DNA binding protein
MAENNNGCSSAQQTYTVEQIAKILGVSVRKAYYLCDETNEFIVKRLGKRCLRINKASFDKWFNASGSDS